jgi:hypothetical protein
MRAKWFWLLAPAVFVLPLGSFQAQDSPPPSTGCELTPAARTAIRFGIKWLVANQNRDGSWGCHRNEPPSVALTSLSILVLMADGSSPQRGPYAKPIRRGLDWIRKNKSRSGLMAAFDSTAMGPVYEHACATLMYATLYGMARRGPGYQTDEDLRAREVLSDALAKLEKLQLPSGGWGKMRGRAADPGVSAMAYLAIRTGYSCGLEPSRADLGKLLEYGRTVTSNSNRVYQTACAVRLFAGQKDGQQDAAKATSKLLAKKLGQDYGKMSEWDYMAAFYSVGGMIHKDRSESWKFWYPYVRDFLVRIQQPDGCWIVEYCLHCKAFATTLALLSLQMPGRYLPSTQY